MRPTPVAGDGQASRTYQHRPGSSGPGMRTPAVRSRLIEAHQPVAPVPVPTMTPEDDWRSRCPSGVDSRYREDWCEECPM
ncbi:MAG TPA: hypothetical protein VGJ07_07945 [Rugosimonospora sp.]